MFPDGGGGDGEGLLQLLDVLLRWKLYIFSSQELKTARKYNCSQKICNLINRVSRELLLEHVLALAHLPWTRRSRP